MSDLRLEIFRLILSVAPKGAFETLKEKRFMDPTTNGASGSTQVGGSDNTARLQQLFNEFSQTLVQLRTVSTEGQQKLETARTRPQ